MQMSIQHIFLSGSLGKQGIQIFSEHVINLKIKICYEERNAARTHQWSSTDRWTLTAAPA